MRQILESERMNFLTDNDIRYPRYRRKGWIGVDLDGTLSHSINGGRIGPPIKPMLERVRYWIKSGREVKIFTARANDPIEIDRIHVWLEDQGLPPLRVTSRKDQRMLALWDDRAVGVITNTGVPIFRRPTLGLRYLHSILAALGCSLWGNRIR